MLKNLLVFFNDWKFRILILVSWGKNCINRKYIIIKINDVKK